MLPQPDSRGSLSPVEVGLDRDPLRIKYHDRGCPTGTLWAMRPLAVVLAAVALAGCGVSTQSVSENAPASAGAELLAAFPEAPSVRPPSAKDVVGTWEVTPQGSQTYAQVTFSPPASLDAESVGKVIVDVGTYVACNGMGGRAEITADGVFLPTAMPQTLMGCDSTVEYPAAVPLQSVTRIGVDNAGNVWLSTGTETFQLVPAASSSRE